MRNSIIVVSSSHVKQQIYLCVFPSEHTLSLTIKLLLDRLFPPLTSVLGSWEISGKWENMHWSLWSTRMESLLCLCGCKTAFWLIISITAVKRVHFNATNSMEQSLFEKSIVTHNQKLLSILFMEQWSSFPCSHERASGPYSEPEKSNPHTFIPYN